MSEKSEYDEELDEVKNECIEAGNTERDFRSWRTMSKHLLRRIGVGGGESMRRIALKYLVK